MTFGKNQNIFLFLHFYKNILIFIKSHVIINVQNDNYDFRPVFVKNGKFYDLTCFRSGTVISYGIV